MRIFIIYMLCVNFDRQKHQIYFYGCPQNSKSIFEENVKHMKHFIVSLLVCHMAKSSKKC